MEPVYKLSLDHNYTNVMVDIETLGINPDSVILSIGACAVEAPTEVQFYQEISIHNQCGRYADLDSVKWWMNQPIKPPMDGVVSLEQTLVAFGNWLGDAFVERGKLIVWANGTDFDISILKHAYETNDAGAIPWKYNNVRDYRTLSKVCSHIPCSEFVGDKHNALADAVYQAQYLSVIKAYYNDIRIGLGGV